MSYMRKYTCSIRKACTNFEQVIFNTANEPSVSAHKNTAEPHHPDLPQVLVNLSV